MNESRPEPTLARRLGWMADAMISAAVGPKARFFSRERVDEIVLLLREAEKEIVNRRGARLAPAGPPDDVELLVELLRHKLDVMHSWNSETTVMFTRIWTRAEIQRALEKLAIGLPPAPPAGTGDQP